MHSEKRFWTLLTLLLVVVALLAAQPATASSSDGMAVDAVPGGGVDASVWVPEGASFQVDVVVTDASIAYAGYQDELSFNSSVVNADTVTQLWPASTDVVCGGTATNNSDNSIPGYTGYANDYGCGSLSGNGTFTGPVTTVTLHCVGNGTSPLHLVTLGEDSSDGTSTLDINGGFTNTSLTDASVTCGGEAPAPTPTPGGATATPLAGATPTPGGTPAPPGATPTPLPPGFEAIDLAAGCNPVATTYADATPIGTIADAVGPAGNLEALWELEDTGWLGYSPAYPEASDLTAKNFLDVVFVCVTGPGAFVRPIV